MSVERLRALRNLLDQALALAPAERDAFVVRATGGDAPLRDELRSLLASAEIEDPRLEPLGPGLGAPAPGARASEPAEGERLGAWKLVRRLGHGGMGSVWLAERADGAYRQHVAIKLPRADLAGPGATARFEAERRVLAALEHPGIARLVNGGTTETGQPWLAMEYVEGQPIDRHCDERRLGVRERVGLVRQVCDALAAAHRHLIVHRDLKPTNVLVRPDGRVVLLDFGIATLLDEEAAARAPYFATPRYSSPEQLRGERAGTAADVYSLGVLLRELLASAAADPDGDLQAVISAATDPDPARRPATVGALGDELGRWLAHLPVRSRPAGLGRRAALFARRSPLAAASLGALALTVTGALAVTTRLWLSERVERRRAEAAEASLERRFAQVRAIVRALVFGVHDRVRTLSGATPVREFLVETALRHLQELQVEAGGDPELLAEAAEIHLRLAEVRGARTYGHLGDIEGGLASARAALALAEPQVALAPGEARWPVLAARAWRSIGDLERSRGELDAALEAYGRARAAAARAAQLAPLDTLVERELAVAELQAGKIHQRRGDAQRALERYAEAAETFDRRLAAAPEDREAGRDLAMLLSERAFAEEMQARREDALASWQRSLGLLDELCARHVDDAQLARDRIGVRSEIVLTLSDLGRDPQALELAERNLVDARELVRVDAGNALAARALERCCLRAARVRRRLGDRPGAVDLCREAETSLRAAHAAAPDDFDVRRDLSECLVERADLERQLGRLDEAERAFEEVPALLPADEALERGDHVAGNVLALAWTGAAKVALARQDWRAAIERGASARPRCGEWSQRHPELDWPLHQLGSLDYGLGTAREALAADPTLAQDERVALLLEARADFQRGRDGALLLERRGQLRASEADMPALFAEDVARVNASLAALGHAPEE